MSDNILTVVFPENDYRSYIRHSDEVEQKYGLPNKKKYPMPDRDHVMSAIKFFNYVSPADEKELAKNILARIKEYGITDINVGENNRFGKYYKSDHLEHHGILGMKWGVRRFQDKNGSLTTAGKARYSGKSGPIKNKPYKDLEKDPRVKEAAESVSGYAKKAVDDLSAYQDYVNEKFTDNVAHKCAEKVSEERVASYKEHYPKAKDYELDDVRQYFKNIEGIDAMDAALGYFVDHDKRASELEKSSIKSRQEYIEATEKISKKLAGQNQNRYMNTDSSMIKATIESINRKSLIGSKDAEDDYVGDVTFRNSWKDDYQRNLMDKRMRKVRKNER